METRTGRGTQVAYKSDQDVRNFCGMLDALAFLPVDRVSDGMRFLQDAVPDNLRGLTEYFDSTYVSGQYRAVVGGGGTMRFLELLQDSHLRPGIFTRRP